MLDLFQLLSSPDGNWWTVYYCDVFIRLSFWRHPFTAEHPLLRHWWNVTFLQIWWRNKLIYILDGLRMRTCPANFYLWWTIPLRRSRTESRLNPHPCCLNQLKYLKQLPYFSSEVALVSTELFVFFPISPWVLRVVDSPPSTSTFASIVEEERKQEAALIRSREKPLALIQVSFVNLVCIWHGDVDILSFTELKSSVSSWQPRW